MNDPRISYPRDYETLAKEDVPFPFAVLTTPLFGKGPNQYAKRT